MSGGEMQNVNATMKRGAEMTRTCEGDLAGRLKTLRGQLEGIGAQWQGMGSVSFVKVMQAWDNHAATVLGNLVELADNLDGTDKEWNITDDEQQQAFSKLQGRLG
jgi:WXG100 family type VII secretion target